MVTRLTSTPDLHARAHPRRLWSTALPRSPDSPSALSSADAARMSPAAADDVCDAALGSFPASDPPSWSPLRVGRPRRER